MISNTRTTLVRTCYSFFSILVSDFEKIWEVLGNFMEHFLCSWCWFEALLCQYQLFNIPDWSWNQGFFFFFSPCLACLVYLVLFCRWSEFSTLIFMWRELHIDDETLQNFISEHSIDLENVKKEFFKRIRENLQDVKLAQIKCQNLFMSKSDHLEWVDHISLCEKLKACIRSIMVMGGVSWRGESREVVKLTLIARLKMLSLHLLPHLRWRRRVFHEPWRKGSGKLCIFSGSQLCSSGLTGLD